MTNKSTAAVVVVVVIVIVIAALGGSGGCRCSAVLAPFVVAVAALVAVDGDVCICFTAVAAVACVFVLDVVVFLDVVASIAFFSFFFLVAAIVWSGLPQVWSPLLLSFGIY